MMHNPKCASMHLDMWCVKTDWLQHMVNAIKSGVIVPDANNMRREKVEGVSYQVWNRIAVIELAGPLMKAWSKYGGTSTLWARQAIRHADRNSDVDKIMLHIDSPGGTSAGTAELGDDVRRTSKLIHAHIDDLGASAAYWVASQADHVTMNRTGLAGSIGTYASVYDMSKMYEMAGVKVHVISTGPVKGAGQPGSEVTEEQLAHWQEIVDGHFAHFENAVRSGRRMLKSTFNKVSDGRVFDAAASKKHGLIDAVASFDAAMIRLRKAKK